MQAIQTVAIPVTTTGDAGSATGTASSDTLFGELIDVYLDFHASAPATTDTTITFAQQGGTILAVSDSSTDARIAPRQVCVNSTNAAITDSYDRFFLNGGVTVALAGCDALDVAVTVYLRVLRP